MNEWRISGINRNIIKRKHIKKNTGIFYINTRLTLMSDMFGNSDCALTGLGVGLRLSTGLCPVLGYGRPYRAHQSVLFFNRLSVLLDMIFLIGLKVHGKKSK